MNLKYMNLHLYNIRVKANPNQTLQKSTKYKLFITQNTLSFAAACKAKRHGRGFIGSFIGNKSEIFLKTDLFCFDYKQ